MSPILPTSVRERSPSPQRPNHRSVDKSRRPSLDTRSRAKSVGPSDFGTLNASTDQLCRSLRAYRRKLTGTSPIDETNVRALERELSLTIKALSEKAVKVEAVHESNVVKLLDQYSARLVDLIDQRMGLGVAGVVSPGSRTPTRDTTPPVLPPSIGDEVQPRGMVEQVGEG